jgi:hypothetical protein
MKLFIIILLILFLLYIILKKNEKFTLDTGSVEITQEMRDRLQVEKINDAARQDMKYISYRDYIHIESENTMKIFLGILRDKNKIMNFFNYDLGIKDRTIPLARSFNSTNDQNSYFNYMNFKKLNVPKDDLDEKYQDTNFSNYTSFFLEAFNPNISMNLFFINPTKERRIRYQLRKKNQTKIISSNYCIARRRGINDIENDNIQFQRSHLTYRYEPKENILINGSYNKPNKNEADDVYNSYLQDTHKLMVDVLLSQEDSEYKKIKNDYNNGNYLLAYEDFNKINKDFTKMYQENFTYLAKNNDKIETVKIEKNDTTGRQILYDDKIIGSENNFYISPGEYSIDIILDKENHDDYKEGLLVSMNYIFNDDFSQEDIVLKDSGGNPISFKILKDSDFRSSGTQDNSYFLKTDISNLISELNYIEKKVKNKQNEFIFYDNLSKLEPERWVEFAKIVLFYVLLEYKKENKTEVENYDSLSEDLFRFKDKYRAERLDDRYVKEPSREYKYYMDRQQELINIENPTVQEQQDLHYVSETLFNMKEAELSRPENGGPLGEDTFKIQGLTDLFNQMADLSSNQDELNTFYTKLKEATGSSFDKDFSKMVDIYIHHYLKSEGDNTRINNKFKLKATNMPEYFTILRSKMETANPDIDGILPDTERSNEALSSVLKTPKIATFNIKVELKEEPKIRPFEVTLTPAVKDDEPPPLEAPVDEFTELVRRVLVLVKKDFRKIIKNKNYEYLSTELELILKSVYRSSQSAVGERKEDYTRVIEIILNLVTKIRDGSIDDINDLLDLDIDSYIFPNEVIQENFSNYNTMNPDIIETFDSGYHKHTSDGRVNFELEWGNPLSKANEGRYDEYTLLSDQSKNQVVNSYKTMETALNKASSMVNNYVTGMDEKMNNVDMDKIKRETDTAIEKAEKTQEELDQEYTEIEENQNEKIRSVRDKLKELEKLQKKRYLGDSKEFNSIKSFGDGQVLSVKNMKDDIYSILVNGQCLNYDKKKDVEVKPCNSSKDQQFKLNNVTEINQFNEILEKNDQGQVGEFDGISYPFQMLNPIQHQSQCLTLNGNSIGVKECMNTNKQRWEGLKNIKTCDKL